MPEYPRLRIRVKRRVNKDAQLLREDGHLNRHYRTLSHLSPDTHLDFVYNQRGSQLMLNGSYSSTRNRTVTNVTSTLLALALLASSAFAETAPLFGKQVKNFTLKDYRGKTHSLDDYKESKAVVLAFVGTECPLAKLYSPRLQELANEYGDSVSFIAVNSNRQDSITEIAANARIHKIQFPVLKDLANKVADQIGATRTPEVFVLDQKRVVRYTGRIDDQYGVGYIRDKVKTRYLKDALDQVLAGKDVAVAKTEVVGCFIGRIRKTDDDSDVTYSNQIARIMQKRCVECHRPGEIAPFSLTNYEEVVGWAETIDEVVRDQRMPPWHASPKHSQFVNDRLMTSEEKDLIHRWVVANAPEGDRSQLPKPPQFTSGWQLPKEPDVVIAMRDKPFDVAAEGTVRYQYFRVDPGFKEDKWVKAAEIIPGNRAVVHHVLAFVRRKGSSRSFSGTEGSFFAAYVPGMRAIPYPDGMAKFVPAGSEIIFQVHYTPIGSPQKDLSKLGLIFAEPDDIKHIVVTREAVERRGLVIPPHASNHRVESRSQTAPVDVQLLAMMPHMHLRGKAFRYEAVYPDGKTEILMDIPRYDFNWQTGYRLAKPKTIPKGAYLHCVAHFDNSKDNLANPDPSATVRWGDQTWNEMMIGYFDIAVPVAFYNAAQRPETRNRPRATLGTVKNLTSSLRKLDKNKDGKLSRI